MRSVGNGTLLIALLLCVAALFLVEISVPDASAADGRRVFSKVRHKPRRRPTPTPTPRPKRPKRTPTPTRTALVNPTVEPSPTTLPTVAPTVGFTPVTLPSITPTAVATATATRTVTSTPTLMPTGTKTPTSTPTAVPTAASTATATATPQFPLVSVNGSLYYTEHAVFIIPDSSQVTWSGPNSWDSVYAPQNISSYVATLKSLFPDDFEFVVVTAANLLPSRVPNVLTYRHLADGIGENSVTGVGVPNICRYAISGTVIDGAFGVLDHEIGHNWGVFVGLEFGSGHWLDNSTMDGQMASVYSDDGYLTVKRISGDPAGGFTWTSLDNLARNESEVFSDQDLYLQGLSESFPPVHVLTSPVYNADHTVSYSAVATYDQAFVEARNGVRSPDYKTSKKRFRIAVVYIARDAAEVQAAYKPIERSIAHFSDSETIDTNRFRFQVPYLVETKYRGSVNSRLADLNGNAAPDLLLTGGAYFTSADGSATVPFSASDPDGPAPSVSCVPASPECSVSGNSVNLSGLSSGTHFFTLKAQDAGGKKNFQHFVVDVQ